MEANKYSDDARTHLTFIEGVISRMNSNSFSMKGWMVTVVAALAALFAGSTSGNAKVYLYIAIIPVIIFWCLDTYYLQLEKKYRKLYEDTVAGNVELYSMNIDNYNGEVCYFKVMISKTEWPVYIPVLVLLIVALIWFA